MFDNFKHYTPLYKALSIDPVYNNNTAQLAFLWNMYNLPTRLMLSSMFMTSLHRTPTLQTFRCINLDLSQDMNWKLSFDFFLLIHCLWYSARWYGFSLFPFCDNLYGGYRNIHSESKLWYKKCKWLFLAIQNYVILSLVQLTNKNIYMCTSRTVEYR